LAEWVRQRGTPAEVFGRIAGAVHRGGLSADVPDPGPGPERLTVRIPTRALPRIREVTHSRNNLVALRKLLLVGYQAHALPAARPAPALPVASRFLPAHETRALVLRDHPAALPARAVPRPCPSDGPMPKNPRSQHFYDCQCWVCQGKLPEPYSERVELSRAILARREANPKAGRRRAALLRFLFWPLVR
jgi:hypothetical protein